LPSSNQRRGYHAEYRCRELLEADGYLVWKSAGSLTAADLIAAKPGEWLLVQVKAGEATLQHDWFNELFEIAHALTHNRHAGSYSRVHAIVADFPKRKMRLRRITGLHVFHAQTWPLEAFSTDEVDE